jgi:hypothetical protein
MSNHDTATIAPVRKQITVHATQQRAFDVFTSGMGAWWNPGQHIGEAPFVDVIVEPHEGGRWMERDAEGTECQWGRVLAWEPPGRVLLAWQLDASWTYDPDLVTELEIRFVAEGPDSTRVELEHRNLDRLGDAAPSVRDSLDSPDGWNGLLAGFAGGLASEA